MPRQLWLYTVDRPSVEWHERVQTAVKDKRRYSGPSGEEVPVVSAGGQARLFQL